MSKKLKMTALLAVLIVILVLAIGLVACDPKTNTYKVTTQFNAEQGDVVLAPEAKDGNYEEGTMVTVSVTAKSGYEFDALTVNTDENAALNNEGKYIFKVTADTQITVLFRSVGPAACEHKNLSALVAGKAATCMEAGVIAHYHCNDCNKDLAEDKTTILESTVINIDPIAHKYGEMQDLQPATCSATGIKAHKDCELCHKHFDAEGKEIPEAELTIAKDENAHDFDVWVAEVPATCSATGTAAHKDCKLCHKHFDNDGKEIAANKYTLAIDSTAHKYGAMQQQKDATCGAAGTKAHKDCTLCGKHFSADNVEIPDNELTIPATGKHTYDKLVNGGEQGHEVHCSVCDAKQSETLTPHTYGTEYVQDGVQGHHQECKECGYHTPIVKHTNKDAQYTFVDEDMHSYQCDDCNYTVYDEHHYGEWINDSAKGEHYHACQECKNEKDRGVHTFAQGATYTNKGEQGHTVECETCHEQIESAHQTTLTYDSDGHYTKCALCDYRTQSTEHNLKYKQEYRSDLDKFNYQNTLVHYQYCTNNCGYADLEKAEKCTGEWKTTDEEHWRECTVCHIIFQNYPKTRHTIEQLHDNNAHWQGCNECGYVQGGEEGKQGHTYDGEWELIKPYPQKHGQKCSVCNFLGNQQDHVYTSETYKPTVGKEQTKHQKVCDYCHELLGEEEDHVWDEETHTTDDGQWEYHICTKCHAESEKTPSKTHTHTSADGKWFVENGQHYQKCKDDEVHFNLHTPKYTLNDGWYEGDGKCEEEGCTISVYTVTDETLTGYTGDFTKIKLPASVFDNKSGATSSITAIGKSNESKNSNGVFASAKFTNMVLPESVKTINKYAFYMAAVKEINLQYITKLEMGALQNSSIVEADLSSLTTAAASVFMATNSLVKVKLNAGAAGMFVNCTALKTVIFTKDFSFPTAVMFSQCTKIDTLVFEGTDMIKCNSSTMFSGVTGTLTVYYKFAKEVYDESQIKDTKLKGANKKFYYATKPSDDPALRDTVSDDEAWYYDSKGEIKLWSEEG